MIWPITNVDRAVVAFEAIAQHHAPHGLDSAASAAIVAPSARAPAATASGEWATVQSGRAEMHLGQVALVNAGSGTTTRHDTAKPPGLRVGGGPLAQREDASAAQGHRPELVKVGRRSANARPLRSTGGDAPPREAETTEEARHRLASGQIEEGPSPEETEALAWEVLRQLKLEMDFDAARTGDDEWD